MTGLTAIDPASRSRKPQSACATCSLRELCLPAGLCAEELERMQSVVYARRRIRRARVQRYLHAVLAREIVRDDGILDARRGAPRHLPARPVAALRAPRLLGLGLPPAHDREELGSYLGLKLETVSRLFSQFQKEGLIEVAQKHVRILDAAALRRLLGSVG